METEFVVRIQMHEGAFHVVLMEGDRAIAGSIVSQADMTRAQLVALSGQQVNIYLARLSQSDV